MNEPFLITDTHPLIYYFGGNRGKLSIKALKAFNAATTDQTTVIYVPPPALWEVAMLIEKNKITLKMPFSNWLNELFTYKAIIQSTFDAETIKHLYGLKINDDPFDKAIVATALQLDLPLITRDSDIQNYKPCKLYWD